MNPKFIGPFKIIACAIKAAYTLKFPDNVKTRHPTFYVGYLKKFITGGDATVLNFTPQLEGLPNDDTYKVEKTVAERGTGKH